MGSVDLNAPQVIVKEIAVGKAAIKEGMNTLTVEVTKLPQQGLAFFGLDKLVFTK